MSEEPEQSAQKDRPRGDLTQLNTSRVILDSVHAETLTEIVGDFLDLLQTSAAVHERNGHYALRICSSDWCRFLDKASRDLCATEDNRKALECGKWLCHKSCWRDASQAAVRAGQPTDVECRGGIRLYAVPIMAKGEIVGAVNFGYGDPPRDPGRLAEIAERYRVSVDELREKAHAYESRPQSVIDAAMKHLLTSAKLIGEIVRRRAVEERLTKEMTAITAVVNDMLRGEVDDAQTEARVLEACLAATDSVYGMIGRINERGKFDTTTYNSRTMQDCAFPEALSWYMSTGMTIRGIWGWPMLHGEPLICNDLAAHPDRVGYPKRHVKIKCFLGVPLKREGQTVGMIAVANTPGGYTKEDKDILVRLASVISVSRQHHQALVGIKRTGQELAAANKDLESEIAERKRAVAALKESIAGLQDMVHQLSSAREGQGRSEKGEG